MFNNSDAANLELYFGCMASVPGPKDGCGFLQGLDSAPFGDAHSNCRDLKDYAATVWSAFKPGDAFACRRYMAATKIRQEDVPRACELFMAAVTKSGQGKAFCNGLKSDGLVAGKDFNECQRDMVYLDGLPNLCPSSPEGDVCRERASFLAAARSGDSRACAASPLCDVLVGRKPLACAPYLARANKLFCDRKAKALKDLSAQRRAARADAERRKAQISSGEAQKAKMARELIRKAKLEEAERLRQAESARQAELARQAESARQAEQDKKQKKRQFQKGERMEDMPPDVVKKIKQLDAGQAPAPAAP